MTGNGYMVTWTYGKYAFPCNAEGFRDEAYMWRKDFPPAFLDSKVREDLLPGGIPINAVLQLKVIAKVLNACDTIIAATDASRRGEMLFRDILRLFFGM